MGVRSFSRVTAWVMALALLVAGSFEAINAKPRKGRSGIKVGLFGGGTVEFGPKQAQRTTGKFETTGSYSVGVFFEQPIYRRLSAAISLDVHDVKLDISILDISETYIDLGLGLKTEWMSQDGKIGLRPGFTMGFGYLKDVEYMGLDPTTYMTVKAFSEIVLCPSRSTGLLFELGLFWAPSGGNDDMCVTGGPMTLLRFGLLF